MIKVLVVFGTRPEAIKMCPLIKELNARPKIDVTVCITAQHREMLDQVLSAFEVSADYDLNIMKHGQTLSGIASEVLILLEDVICEVGPDIILVHGDTTTTFASSLAAFYHQVRVGHVEAGLRTYNKHSPFPEEMNRALTGKIADLHFAPTVKSKDNLLHEGVSKDRIFVTGNTAIDALYTTVSKDYRSSVLNQIVDWVDVDRLILLTTHRRENLGEPMRNIFSAIKKVMDAEKNIKVLYPIHPNPAIRSLANQFFAGTDRLKIVEPLEVVDFHNIMARAYVILTDSGGIQEEAPSLGKPVLVLRDTTERPEGVTAGALELVGTCEKTIFSTVIELLNDERKYEEMSKASNPYGDGTASRQIADIVIKHF